ncbi:SusC/RagA family TonB-linked outer membrane protein, partial [uncultured Chitinophaga sp.]|uniref:STN domain-containing protein n=1 Tax=uncultured Chitinophaga sp. TaxID=339340 RepID=UPI0025CDC315
MTACLCNLNAQARNADDKGSLPVTLSGQDIPLEKVLKSIEKQTGLRFNYRSELLNINEKVSVNFRNRPLDEILGQLLQPRGFAWKYIGTAITLQLSVNTFTDTLINFSGKVMSAEGTPLPGATVVLKGTRNGVSSNADGGFSLRAPGNGTLVVTYTGYQAQELRIGGKREAMVQMVKAVNEMNEQVVVAYGTTTQRSNTGAVTVIKGSQIENLPNRSFDKSLQGLVPGLLVTNGTGQPGGGVANMVVRGISSGSD